MPGRGGGCGPDRGHAGACRPGHDGHGTTDELGLRAVDKPYHVHDIHATILHLMGLNHVRLTFHHNGRDERATIHGGKVITDALA